MKILVTGCAGFIGFHFTKKLIENNSFVIGIDNLNNYYDVKLKRRRLKILKEISKQKKNNFIFYKSDISKNDNLKKIFKKHRFNYVMHLAAQAGVRYSLKNPDAYVKSNLVGFANILENCRRNRVKHLLYASTSSVYGANTILPYKESDRTDHPLQFYAATKRSNELMAHSYSHLFNLPTTGLRFFTVYGPWGRPDMALYKFTKSIVSNKPVELFNKGDHRRSFTYIDDVVVSMLALLVKIPRKKELSKKHKKESILSSAPFQIINIGNEESATLKEYLKIIEKKLKKISKRKLLPLQSGDIKSTIADTNLLRQKIKFRPRTKIDEGISNFVNWYLKYNKKI